MTPQEIARCQILDHIHTHYAWPPNASTECRTDLVHTGFVEDTGAEVYLTGLGEVELEDWYESHDQPPVLA